MCFPFFAFVSSLKIIRISYGGEHNIIIYSYVCEGGREIETCHLGSTWYWHICHQGTALPEPTEPGAADLLENARPPGWRAPEPPARPSAETPTSWTLENDPRKRWNIGGTRKAKWSTWVCWEEVYRAYFSETCRSHLLNSSDLDPFASFFLRGIEFRVGISYIPPLLWHCRFKPMDSQQQT